jgi:hypothetical protein
MTTKFEQLIEYVINDEQDKAKALFHDIVVEKSREIYEDIMEEEDDAERDDHAEKAGKRVAKDIEYDEKHDKMDESMGGDAADDLMADVEVDEEGMSEDEELDAEFDDEAEEDMGDHHDDVGGNEELEDRVVDLEDKLDELMAEFEAMMGDEGSESEDDEFEMDADSDEVGGDAMADDDTEEFVDVEQFSENVSLKAAPKPVTAEPAGTDKTSPNANNSGARGAMAQPVKMVGDIAKGGTPVKAGNLPDAGNFKNVPGKDGSKLAPAPKPVTTQAAGVNAKTPFPKV